MIRNSININNINNLLCVLCLPRKYGEARLVRGGYFLHYHYDRRRIEMKKIFAIPMESGKLCAHFGRVKNLRLRDDGQ